MAESLLRLMARALTRAQVYGRIRSQQISVLPDPVVPNAYAVRVRRRSGPEDYLVRASGPLGLRDTQLVIEEVRFPTWPPSTF